MSRASLHQFAASRSAQSRMTSSAPITCARVVSKDPAWKRMAMRPSTFVWVRNIRPSSLMRLTSAMLCASTSATPSGTWRKVNSDSIGSVTISQPGSAAINAASSPLQATWSRDHGAQPFQTVSAQEEPDLEGPKPAPERHGPFRVVDDPVATVRLQKLRPDRERANQIVGLTHEMGRAVELRAQPFVGVENNRVRRFDPCPEVAELRADHRRARPGRIHMNVQAMLARHGADRRYIIGATNAGAADAGNDAGRQNSPPCDPSRSPHRGQQDPCRAAFRSPGYEPGFCRRCRRSRWRGRWKCELRARHKCAAPARLRGRCCCPASQAPFFAHGQHRGECGGRGGVLDDAGETVRQAECLTQPVEHACLRVSVAGGRCLPEHALRGHGVDQMLGHHRGRGGICREIGKEAGDAANASCPERSFPRSPRRLRPSAQDVLEVHPG